MTSLIPTPLANWKRNQREEAARLGYTVEFTPFDDKYVAVFFNGEFWCYTRTYPEQPPPPICRGCGQWMDYCTCITEEKWR